MATSATAEQAPIKSPKKPGWRKLIASLGNRKTGYMALFGFAAGLPYALLLGTLYAWLSDAEVDLETMGVFSLIGLAYAFKFLWSPLLDRVDLPILRKLGKRKQWIVTAQVLLGAILVILSTLDPVGSSRLVLTASGYRGVCQRDAGRGDRRMARGCCG